MVDEMFRIPRHPVGITREPVYYESMAGHRDLTTPRSPYHGHEIGRSEISSIVNDRIA